MQLGRVEVSSIGPLAIWGAAATLGAFVDWQFIVKKARQGLRMSTTEQVASFIMVWPVLTMAFVMAAVEVLIITVMIRAYLLPVFGLEAN